MPLHPPSAIRPPPPSLPSSLGLRMPAEWAPHEATWLSWPKDPESFPPDILPQVEEAYARMVEALVPDEKVHLLVDDAGAGERVRGILSPAAAESPNLLLHAIPTVDVWFRDYGPTFLLPRRPPPSAIPASPSAISMVRWEFSAWGGKYKELKADSAIPEAVAALTGARVFRPGIVLEGGSIDVDGEGACLTTEQCLLNPNRNPSLSRGEIEAILRAHLGVETVLWLGEGIAGDDTDGHVDDIARFTGPATVVCAVERDRADANFAPLKDGLERLRAFRDARGRSLRVVELPMPRPVLYRGRRLPASYANFYIANGKVLVPTFGQESDGEALRILAPLFPGRALVPIPCAALVAGLGAVHCVTQQQPLCPDTS